MPPKPLPVSERFWRHVHKTEDCWTWAAHRQPHGYGKFMLHGVGAWAHRVAWELTNGAIPSGTHVCHRCDNPSCVRPDHLFLGSPAENQQDSVRKGRHIRGTKSGTAKLTEADAIYIRSVTTRGRGRRTGGVSQRELAKRFGVTQTAIAAVRLGKTWAHLGTS